MQISPTVGSLAETTLSCEYQQQQPHHHHQLGDDDVSFEDDDDELCYSGALDDVDHAPAGYVDVPMSRPLVSDRRRQQTTGPAAAVPTSDVAAVGRTHCCFTQHAVVASR